ncbi:MAG: hypothetical protein ACRDPK_09205 [Carbonactinosporaceae bacterium]
MLITAASASIRPVARPAARPPYGAEVPGSPRGCTGRSCVTQFRLALRRARTDASLSEHLGVIEAIVARNPPAAEQAARLRLLSVIAALRSFGEAGAPSAPLPAGPTFQGTRVVSGARRAPAGPPAAALPARACRSV